MQLELPFFPMPAIHSNYCGQYVLKSVFKFLLNKEYSLDYLSKISGKFRKGYTLTIGLAYSGLKEGLKVKFITTNSKLFSNDEVRNLQKFYANNQLHKIQEKAAVFFKKAKKLGLDFEVRTPSLKEIISEIKKENPVVVVIDNGKIYGENKQVFHFALITGYDGNNIYFHDVGPNNPTANKRVDKKLFIEAWNAPGTDKDTLVFHNHQ